MRRQHMDLIQNDDLQMLLDVRTEPVISIYMPTVRMGRETRQNAIRFKNLVTEAENKLQDSNLMPAEQNAMLESVRDLENDTVFWDYQSKGLALFITPETFYTYRLPLDFEETVVVGDRLHLKPLMPLISHDAHFYVLALSMDQVRLFQGAAHGMSEVQLPEEMPTSLEESLHMDDPEARLNVRTTSTSYRGEGDQPATFHGHTPDDEHKDNIRRHSQRIDNTISDLLNESNVPLILAGVEYVQSIYRDVNSYQHVIDEGINGSPDEAQIEDLHQQAWALIEPLILDERQQAVERYHALVGTDQDQTADDLERVVAAAHYGQIDTLFVLRGKQTWGTFEPQTGTVQVQDDATPDTNDLLDAAAVQTLKNSGTVYVVDEENMPSETAVAAVLRY